MTYISLREFIDDILLIVRNNNISESEDLSRHQIATWIKSYKQMLLKNRLDQQKQQCPNNDELEDYIDDIFIREKGPLELEEIDPEKGEGPIFTRRTIQKLENVYDDDDDSIIAIHDRDGCVIQYMNHFRRHFQYFRKYTGKELTAYYDDGYIYVQGNSDNNKLKYIWVKAIFEDLATDNDSEDVDEDDIKIPSWLIPPIKDYIFKNELSFMLNRPSDDSNNATLASVKPHGPQDEQE